MEEMNVRGVHSAVDDIRRNVFTEVARLAYEGGDMSRVDMVRCPTTVTTCSWSVPSWKSGCVWPWA